MRDSRQPQKPNPIKDYLRYSGLAAQMSITLLAGYWLGLKLDEAFEIAFPAFRIALILAALAISFYSLLKNLPKN